MLQDFERNRPPEIDGLLTAVQAFARAAGEGRRMIQVVVLP